MTNEEFIQSIALPGEKWQDIIGFEDFYMVSTLGRIIRKFSAIPRSDNHNTSVTYPRLLTPTIMKNKKQRYFYVSLSVHNKRYRKLVHRLVALTFIKNPLNKPEIDHIDGNGLNNIISNLRWCNHSENNMNQITRMRQAKSHIGKKMPTLWKPVVCISKDGEITHYKSMSDAEKNGFGRSSIIDSIKHPNRPIRKRRWMYLSDYESQVSMSKNSNT